MKKDDNTDWISVDNSTFKMINGKPVKIEEKTRSHTSYIAMFLIVFTVIVSAIIMSSNAGQIQKW